MANGYEIEATVEQRLAPGAPAELYAVAPLRLWHRTACGVRRQPVPNPPAALLARVAPGLARRPASLVHGDAGASSAPSGSACLDPRWSVELALVRHRFVLPTVHRFELVEGAAEGDGEVVLLLSGKPLRTWRLTREALPSTCPADHPAALPWTLDLEVLCAGDFSLVTATTWRPALSSACIPYQPGSRPQPGAPACALDRIPPRSWLTRESERLRVHLGSASVEALVTRSVELHP